MRSSAAALLTDFLSILRGDVSNVPRREAINFSPARTAFQRSARWTSEWERVAHLSEVVANTDGEGEDTVGRAKSEGVGVLIAMSR